MKRAIYVDYENVNISGLEAIEELSNEDVVKIFIGAQTSKLTMVDANRIFNCEASVELITNKYIGKNALDFIIMVHMGYDIAQGLAKSYYIISKDKGYDPAIHEMRKMSGLTVSRREDISAVLEERKSIGGKIKGFFGIGKVKETPDTTQHTVVGKGKKDSNDMSKITKEYVSDEPTKQSKNQKRGKKTEKPEKSDKIEKAEKMDNSEKPKKHDKPKKYNNYKKYDKSEKTGKFVKSEKSENTDKFGKTIKSEKTGKVNSGNGTEKSKKTNKSENSGKADAINKVNKNLRNQKHKPVSQQPANQQPDNQNSDKVNLVTHENIQKGSSNNHRKQREKKYGNENGVAGNTQIVNKKDTDFSEFDGNGFEKNSPVNNDSASDATKQKISNVIKHDNKQKVKELVSAEAASDVSVNVSVDVQKDLTSSGLESEKLDDIKDNGLQNRGKGRSGNRYNNRGSNNRRKHYEKHNDDSDSTKNKVSENDVSDKNENPAPSDNDGFSNKMKVQDRTESVEVVRRKTEFIKDETAVSKHETELERQRREAFELLAELNEEDKQPDNFKYKKRK